VATLPRPEFVGREAELAALGECVTAALEGYPRLVICRGEAGIGKTRLAEELLDSARTRGVVGSRGAAAAADGATPYRPWRQVLSGIADSVDVTRVADEHSLTADLTWLAPGLFGDADRPMGDTESAEDRLRQFDALAMLLGRLTHQVPLVLTNGTQSCNCR